MIIYYCGNSSNHNSKIRDISIMLQYFENRPNDPMYQNCGTCDFFLCYVMCLFPLSTFIFVLYFYSPTFFETRSFTHGRLPSFTAKKSGDIPLLSGVSTLPGSASKARRNASTFPAFDAYFVLSHRKRTCYL